MIPQRHLSERNAAGWWPEWKNALTNTLAVRSPPQPGTDHDAQSARFRWSCCTVTLADFKNILVKYSTTRQWKLDEQFLRVAWEPCSVVGNIRDVSRSDERHESKILQIRKPKTMIFKKRHPAVGAPPGTLVIDEDAPAPKIHVIHYTSDGVRAQEVTDVEQLREALAEDSLSWVDVQGFGDERTVRRIAKMFSLHSLAIEDIVNVPQRPKLEVYDEELLLITRMVRVVGPLDIEMEQVSIVLGKSYVLTFQERYGDILDPVRSRIHDRKSLQIRRQGPDHLAYAILDTIVDGYYPVLETLGDQLEDLEDDVIDHPGPILPRRLNRTKNMLSNLRRSLWPQREAVSSLIRNSHPFLSESTRTYLRDTYDHCAQTFEVVEMYREMTTGLMNIYLSSMANRTNEVMKVLTITASIFIPLTFLAGIYGMNFDHMPELHVWWSYPLLLSVMLLLAVGMIFYFQRKGWIGQNDHEASEDDAS